MTTQTHPQARHSYLEELRSMSEVLEAVAKRLDAIVEAYSEETDAKEAGPADDDDEGDDLTPNENAAYDTVIDAIQRDYGEDSAVEAWLLNTPTDNPDAIYGYAVLYGDECNTVFAFRGANYDEDEGEFNTLWCPYADACEDGENFTSDMLADIRDDVLSNPAASE